ncbi:MAG: hypothetical protein OXE02_05565 [Chloroflexi bacterium]|nr:hypothetical protein [Chloroflexota bacterium]
MHAPTLYHLLLGDAWHALPDVLRQVHETDAQVAASGAMDVTLGRFIGAGLVRWALRGHEAMRRASAAMRMRIIPVATLAALLLLLAACDGAPSAPTSAPVPTSTPALTPVPTPTPRPTRTPTVAPTPTATLSPYTGYLVEEMPPCTPVRGASVDPCEPGAPRFEGSIAPGYLPDLGDEPWSLREMLDDPSLAAWVTHLVLRGTYLPGTTRCSAGDLYHPLPHLTEEWDERSFKCYIDVRANAYVLGSGPPTLTVLMFVDYVYSAAAEEGIVEEYKQDLETLFEDAFPGIEHVLFLGPSDDLSSEAWRFFGYWDVQREDGTVVAVHPERDLWRTHRPGEYYEHLAVLEMELPAFTQAVTTANQARVSEYGGRIGADSSLPMLLTDANQLRQYYVNVGAYDDPDSPPAQPPPVPGEGDPVPDIGVDDAAPTAPPAPPGGESTPTPVTVP